MLHNLQRFILPTVAGPSRHVPLAALAGAEVTVAALRQAAQRGRLDAVLGPDGVWRSTKSAVTAYLDSRARRRRDR